jgi:hypothetical protein
VTGEENSMKEKNKLLYQVIDAITDLLEDSDVEETSIFYKAREKARYLLEDED